MEPLPEQPPDTLAAQMRKHLQRMSLSIIVLFLLLIALALFNWYKGLQIHDSFCALRAELVHQQEDAHAFLALPKEERIKKYGQALGSIDPDVLRVQMEARQDTIDALASLHCE